MAPVVVPSLEEKRAKRAAYMREWNKTHPQKRTEEGKRRRYAWMSERRRQRKAADPEWATMIRQQAHQGRTPEAHRAQEKLRREVKAGRVVRPDACQQCGAVGLVEGAHHDYARPLDVSWLCRSCHRRYDRESKGGYVRVGDRP